MAFAGLILAVGLVYEGMALYMPRGSLAQPGPGFFPVVIGVFLIVTAVGCVLQETLAGKRDKAQTAPPLSAESGDTHDRRSVHKTFQLLVLMIGYALALKPIGFLISIFLFLVVAIRIFGYRRWLPTLAMTAVIAGLSYIAFILWLKVPLPLGILDEVFG